MDEILAVGDQTFQEKCQERIRELRERGTTFVCVSHSPKMLLDLCDVGLWLDHEQVVLQGKMRDVLSAYQGPPDGNGLVSRRSHSTFHAVAGKYAKGPYARFATIFSPAW